MKKIILISLIILTGCGTYRISVIEENNKVKTYVAGGRYNDLTYKNFGFKKIPAVGAAVNLGIYE